MKGYEKLGLLTSEFDELLILRRFDRLSARILLRQQAELLYLEQELDLFVDEDDKEDPQLSVSFSRWRDAADSGRISVQLEKYNEIEQKLNIYRTAFC